MLKVVIADDEARILSLIRLLPDWDALGIEVAGTAGNGLEALALIERERPDILITDIRMPGCQGLELIEGPEGPFPISKSSLSAATRTSSTRRPRSSWA